MAHAQSPTAPAEPAAAAEVVLTWSSTKTYTHPLTLAQVATAAGRDVGELRVDPVSVLAGLAGQRLADLLAAHQHEAVAVGPAEVEVTDAFLSDQPSLDDLIRTAWQHVGAEAGRRTGAGQALAALLVGLRREGITHR